jgi:hypothetical protein
MSIQRWNEATGRYEPFSAGERKYPPLSPTLRAQLEHVPPTTDGTMEYRPCKLTLKDGTQQDFVYVVDAAKYIRTWSVWPDQDKGKQRACLG